jgi:hypothetical protein
METNKPTIWQNTIPIFIAVSCIFMLGFMIFFLYKNLFWFQAHALDTANINFNDEYKLSVFVIQNNIINKSSGLLAGFTIMVLGLSSAFYTLKDASKIKLESSNISATILTTSPGIIAMLLGCIISITTLTSSEELPKYKKSVNPVNIPSIIDTTQIVLPQKP